MSEVQTITQFLTHIFCHPNHVGFVIGSGGTTIKRIAKQVRAFISLDKEKKDENGYVAFVIKGQVMSNVENACDHIKQVMEIAKEKIPIDDSQNITSDQSLENEARNQSQGSFLSPKKYIMESIVEYKTFVFAHPDHVSFIIGKQGETIKNIGKNTKTFVRIDNKMKNEEGFTGFQIKGETMDSISQAKDEFFKLARNANKIIPRVNVNNETDHSKKFNNIKPSRLEKKFTVADVANFKF